MVLQFIDESKPRFLKTIFYGIDGSGKSTGAQLYCESRGLNPVVIDFDCTNHTGLPRLKCDWDSDRDVINGVISIIKDVETDSRFDTLIIDGVGTFNNLLLPKGKESQRTYLVRTQNFKKIWKVLLHAKINVIFIGQKDMIVTEENESSKFAEMINNMVDYKFHCIHTGKGFTNDDFTYVCTKTRGEIEPLIGKPIISEPVTSSIPVTPKEEAPMPHLIKECMDALFERGMEPTEERVRTCIEDRCKNVSDKTVYNECMEWLDNNLTLGGV